MEKERRGRCAGGGGRRGVVGRLGHGFDILWGRFVYGSGERGYDMGK